MRCMADSGALSWPSGDGEMAGRIRAHDWAASPLGPVETWPSTLRNAVQMILASGLPMLIAWGEDCVEIYNDGLWALAGAGQAHMPGRPDAAGRLEFWSVNRALYARARAGESVAIQDVELIAHGADGGHRAWFSGSVCPLQGDGGEPGGVIIVVFDATDRVLAEAALREREARQVFLTKLNDALRPLAQADQIRRTACRMLGEHLGAARAYYVQCDASDGSGSVADDYALPGLPSLAGRYPYETFGTTYERVGQGLWVMPDVAADTQLERAERDDYRASGAMAWVDVPLVKEGRLEAILCVVDGAARRWTPSETELVAETADRLWAAVERSRAEARWRESVAWLAGQKDAFRAAVDDAPLDESLGILVRTALAQEGPGVRCAFYLADPAGEQLRPVAGMDADDAPCVDSFRIGPESLACGLAVHTGRPVITADVRTDPLWSSWLSLAEQDGYRAVWSFPIQTAAHRVVGAFAMYFAEPRAATPRDHEFASVLTQAAAIIISRGQEAEARRRSEARQDLALHELQHRVRNILAMVRSVARRTTRTAGSVEAMGQLLDGRLDALARTQALLTRATGSGVDLELMLREELLAQAPGLADIVVEGPRVTLSAKAAEVLASAIHELATNATRYGAIGQGGSIQVAWGISRSADDQDWLHLVWTERGVQLVAQTPRCEGLGVELIEQRVPCELKGRGRIHLRPGGITAEISFPMLVETAQLSTTRRSTQ